MTTLTSGQLELRADTDDALVIGRITSFAWTEDGPSWWGAPEVRTADVEYSSVDGLLAGRDLLGKHTTNLAVAILGSSEDDLAEKIDQWKTATAAAADELVAVRACLLGQTRRRYGRFRIPGEITAVDIRTWTASASTQFEALDPVTYGDDETSAATTRETAGTGFTVPFLVPFAIGASTTGGLTITNNGNRPAPWTARLDGPLTYPEITHTQSGRRLYLSLDANGGVDLASGQWLTIDSAARSVMLNDTADQRSRLTIDSQWWDLEPGQNDFLLRADAGTGTLTVTARDAWHS